MSFIQPLRLKECYSIILIKNSQIFPMNMMMKQHLMIQRINFYETDNCSHGYLVTCYNKVIIKYFWNNTQTDTNTQPLPLVDLLGTDHLYNCSLLVGSEDKQLICDNTSIFSLDQAIAISQGFKTRHTKFGFLRSQKRSWFGISITKGLNISPPYLQTYIRNTA